MPKKAKGKKALPRKRGQSGSASVVKPNWEAEVVQAQREMERNKALILAGETFAAGKHTGPEKSPSSNHDGRYA
jgi:hypothetical protein